MPRQKITDWYGASPISVPYIIERLNPWTIARMVNIMNDVFNTPPIVRMVRKTSMIVTKGHLRKKSLR